MAKYSAAIKSSAKGQKSLLAGQATAEEIDQGLIVYNFKYFDHTHKARHLLIGKTIRFWPERLIP
jgi:hypothetical protein